MVICPRKPLGCHGPAAFALVVKEQGLSEESSRGSLRMLPRGPLAWLP
jgi:hypothetical protein